MVGLPSCHSTRNSPEGRCGPFYARQRCPQMSLLRFCSGVIRPKSLGEISGAGRKPHRRRLHAGSYCVTQGPPPGIGREGPGRRKEPHPPRRTPRRPETGRQAPNPEQPSGGRTTTRERGRNSVVSETSSVAQVQPTSPLPLLISERWIISCRIRVRVRVPLIRPTVRDDPAERPMVSVQGHAEIRHRPRTLSAQEVSGPRWGS